MKRLIIMLIATIAITGAFAQKSKINSSNTLATQIQIQNSCPAQAKLCPNANSNLSKKEQMKMVIMKIYTCPMHTQTVNTAENNSLKCSDCKSQLAIDRRSSKHAGLTTNCSMDANRNSAKMGKCPICKKDLNISKG